MTNLSDQVHALEQRIALLEAQSREALRGTGILGDDRNTGVLSATWVPVSGWKDLPLLGAASGQQISATVRAERRTLNVATSVQLRILQLPATVMVTGVAYNADTAWNPEELSFMPTDGLYLYQLQIQGSDAVYPVLGVGRV